MSRVMPVPVDLAERGAWRQRALRRQPAGGALAGDVVPYGAPAVNLAGCLAVGAVATLVTGRLSDRPDVDRLVVIVGFLGSLTTFSSFAY